MLLPQTQRPSERAPSFFPTGYSKIKFHSFITSTKLDVMLFYHYLHDAALVAVVALLLAEQELVVPWVGANFQLAVRRSTMCSGGESNRFLILLLLLCWWSSAVTAAAGGKGTASSSTTSDDMNILLNCGATVLELDEYNRTWTGDDGTSFAKKSFENTSVDTPTAGSTANQADPPMAAPYTTGRFFTSNFTYSFPVLPGRQFVRLYFYLSNYVDHPASSARFSVSTGEFTLLVNFSSAQASGIVTREYSINVSSKVMDLTFAPSPNRSNSYAFVNGIEIVSMPPIFSSTNPPLFVGSDLVYTTSTIVAFETVYRLNVGGADVSPMEDSGGLARRWYNDSSSVFGDVGLSYTYARDENFTIEYAKESQQSIAPQVVYRTARSMGLTGKLHNSTVSTSRSNLTWFFMVDPGFYYLIRLHFCEIQGNVTEKKERVFDIIINNKTAVKGADVIAWSDEDSGGNGGLGVPVFRDFVIDFPDGSNPQDIWLVLRPNLTTRPTYNSSILNGLEIFKLVNGSNGNLAGVSPLPVEKQGKVSAIVGGLVSGVAFVGLLLFLLVVYCFLRRSKVRSKESDVSEVPSASVSALFHGINVPASSDMSPHAKLGRQFTFSEIETATNGFDESLLLGIGGFGRVYKGKLNGGSTSTSTSTDVAIKRGNKMSDQGALEFQTEIMMVSNLRHLHLVSLIGFCEENNEMILVYDYMAHGTLRQHLYNSDKPPLPWKQRLEICIGAARGLHYLHTGAKPTIIHRDVKTTNILLDEKWVAKVSDFGLSKVGPVREDTHVSTVVKGSFGYLDPEYFRRQKLTQKSDVYSFGVVLFEVLCARPPVDPELPKEQMSLPEWAIRCRKEGDIGRLVDPNLDGQISPDCMERFVDIAEKCVWDNGVERPTMGDVLWNLELALQVQVSSEEKTEPSSTDNDNDKVPKDSRRSSAGATFDPATINGDDDDDSYEFRPDEVFLELLNAKAR